MSISKSMQRIPKRYRPQVQAMLSEQHELSKAHGITLGEEQVKRDLAKNIGQFNSVMHSGLLMTFQRLGDANAQMTTQFTELLKRMQPK